MQLHALSNRLRVSRFSAGATTSSAYLYPIGINLNGAQQLAVGSDGSLWWPDASAAIPPGSFR